MLDKGKVLLVFVGVAMALVLVAGCGASSGSPGGDAGGSGQKAQKAYAPRIEAAEFTTRIDNKYFPLKPGTTFVYKGKFHGTAERDVMAVTDDTKRVMGVECLVASDRVTEGGALVEQTYDWYAQDKEGNVWYFGEDVTEYKNGNVTGHEGSWESGVDGARPGIAMKADPRVGQTYRQEYSKGVAEDKARVVSLNGSVKVPFGKYDRVLVTEHATSISSSTYGSVFYLTTGFHALHVIGGLVAFVYMLIRSTMGRFTPAQATSAIVVSYYWHFVDVVWVGLFATIYLIR